MRRFGRALDRLGVDYLLISGQAAVLYGAAVFSEDVDIWVDPRPSNWLRLIRALRACRARVHKLTPPLRTEFLCRGHGYHFMLPADEGVPGFLDVLGCPPRVAGFDRCQRRARVFETEWGPMPVVSIEDLVLLKRTRRLADYDVISKLVDVRLREAERTNSVSPALLRWALCSSFSAENLLSIMQRWPRAVSTAKRLGRPVLWNLVSIAGKRGRYATHAMEAASNSMLLEIARCQRADLRFWHPVLAELRRLRKAGKLLPEGSRV